MNKTILILHGPNLNLLGNREPEHYGTTSLKELNNSLLHQAKQSNVNLVCFQSNSEGELINKIHQSATENINYIIFNPAGFTHSSIVLRDALVAVSIPFVEVHLSNIFARETFRHYSYFSDIAKGTISGLGTHSYNLALTYVIHELERQ